MTFLGLKQVQCVMTRHVPPSKDEEKLFEGYTLTVDSECERCHTPIILERDPKDSAHYYITEYIEVED